MQQRPHFLPTRLAAAAVLSLALAGGLSACGGDDDSSADPSSDTSSEDTGSEDTGSEDTGSEDTSADPATDATSAEDFVAEANGVCSSLYADINAVGVTLDPAAPDAVTTDFLPLVQELQDQLVALSPPEEMADGYAEVLALQQENLDLITADPSALFSIDGALPDDAFDALGITTCGSDSVNVTP